MSWQDTYESKIDAALTKLDQTYVQKYLSDPSGIEKLILDKEAFVRDHGLELYNQYLSLGLHKQRASTEGSKEKSN